MTSFTAKLLHAAALALPLALTAGGAAAQSAATSPPAATLDRAGSEIVFVSRQMGVPVEGRFTKYSAQIALDPKAPQGGSVALTIDTGSAAFGAPELDGELPKPVWFDSARFPQALFRSSAVKGLGGDRYEVAGTLTIKGRSSPLTVPVTLARSGPLTIASGSFAIKRLEFGIGAGEWADPSLLGNEVQVRFKLALSGLPHD